MLPRVVARVLGPAYPEVDGRIHFAMRLRLPTGEANFGLIPLTQPDKVHGHEVGSAAASDFFYRIYQVCGVTPDRLGGQVVYALVDGDRIEGIQRLEIDGEGLFTLGDWRRKWPDLAGDAPR